jgi:stage IV sporulation protein FB
MLRFTLFNFPVIIHWFFWVNVALLGGAINASSPRQIQMLAGWVLAAFLSVLIHELGHAFAMRRFGDRRVDILLYAFGGLARGGRWLSRREDMIVSAAGPALQLAAGVVMELLFGGVRLGSLFLASFAQSFIHISFWWALLNLLPIIPLDGGHIFRAFLGQSRLRLSLTISLVCAIAMTLYSFQGGGLFVAVFFGMMAFNNWRELQGQPQVPWMEGR